MFEKLFRGKRAAEVVEGLLRQFAENEALGDLNPNELFETFSAYCVLSRYYDAEFEPDELRMGQPRDMGIDAWAVLINDKLLTDVNHVEKECSAAKKIDAHFVIVQAKRERRYDSSVFGSLASSLLNIFDETVLPFPAGPKAQNLRMCVKALRRHTHKFNAAPRLSVWYTSLANFRVGAHEAKINEARNRLVKSKHFSHIELQEAGAHEMRALYERAESMSSVTFAMKDRLDLPGMPGVDSAVIGVMHAREVVEKLLLDENGKRRPFLYHDNMRDFLGVGTKVNEGVQASLRDSNARHRFVVLNNGITIVTRGIVESGSHLTATDPQIVNGCQTCNILLENRDTLDDDILVGVRVIVSTDEDVVGDIIAATNTQNALTGEVLGARDRFQKLLEDFFVAQPPSRRLYYERRLGQYGKTVEQSRVVSRRHLTQAYTAMWLDDPHGVRSYQALVRAHSASLFRPQDDPLPYYTAAAALYRISRQFAGSEDMGISALYRPTKFHLVAGIKLLLAGDGPVPKSGAEAAARCNAVLEVMWDPSRSKRVVDLLIGAVHEAMVPAGGMSRLGQEVRNEQFTKRFRGVVLELSESYGAVA